MMHVFEDCPKMEHSSLHFQVLFNREESKLHFLVIELFILKLYMQILSGSVNAKLDIGSPFIRGLCVKFLLLHRKVLQVIPSLSGLKYGEKKKY